VELYKENMVGYNEFGLGGRLRRSKNSKAIFERFFKQNRNMKRQ